MNSGRSNFAKRARRLALTSVPPILVMTASVANAQSYAPPAAPPIRPAVDENGVDLRLGRLDQNVATVSAGPSGANGVEFSLAITGASMSESDSASIYWKDGGQYTVIVGGRSIKFTQVGSAFTEVEANGNTLTFNESTYKFTFTDRDGVRYIFFRPQNLAPNGEGPDGLDMGPLIEIIEPNGRQRTFTYTRGFLPLLNQMGQVGTVAYRRLQSAQSNTGWMVKPEYANDTPTVPTLETWHEVVKATAFDNTIVGCSASADSCTMPAGYEWPTITVSTDGLGQRHVTHANGVQEVVLPTSKKWSDGTYHFVATISSGKVSAVTSGGVLTSYAYTDASGIRTTTRTTPVGSEVYKFDIAAQILKEHTTATGHKTEFAYDSKKRLTRITYPELNYDEMSYDARGNLVQLRKVAKPGSGLADIVTSASYDATCANIIKCNKPNSVTDARGKVTDFTYDPVHGGILTVTAPAATAGGVRPQTRYTYTLTAGIYELTGVSTCKSTASCAGTADEAKRTITHNAKNLTASVTIATGDGSVSATSAMGYDPIGNLITIDGPLAGTGDTTRFRYNAGRQQIGTVGPDPDATGTRKHLAQKTTLDAKGRVVAQASGTVNSQSDTDWAAFSAITTVTSSYNASDQKVKDVLSGTSGAVSVTQYSYDTSGRLRCTVQRMNSATWASLSNDACIPETSGSFGPDRISRNSYNAANQLIKAEAAVSTTDQSDETTLAYTPNGQLDYVIDAESNRTNYSYDGFDRLTKTEYPVSTKGANAANPSDYELLTYDASDRVVSRRLRDSTTIGYGYDDLNRLVLKDLPGTEPDVSYSYDLLGRAASAIQGSQTLTFAHDALGRNLGQSGPLGATSYTYDVAGRRTSLTYPGGYLTINYDYDILGNVTAIRENGATSGVGVLATYAYDDASRKASVTFGNGTSQSFSYDAASRLLSVTNDLLGASTAKDLIQSLTYNPGGQIASVTRSNDAYAWQGHYNVDRNYSANGLNQLSVVAGTNFSYDARGNLTSDGANSLTYTAENLLKSASNGTTLKYDPLGRLFETAKSPSTRRFMYDGVQLIAEFDASDSLRRRYVHGPGIDNPIVQYNGSVQDLSQRFFLMGDERGSIVSVTDGANSTVLTHSYDEYGIPGGDPLSRFGYTGQVWLPEVGMWYYKARIYSPTLGRFMQTDPIGYEDGMNLYNYVGSDPVNLSDPSGQMGTVYDATITGKRWPNPIDRFFWEQFFINRNPNMVFQQYPACPECVQQQGRNSGHVYKTDNKICGKPLSAEKRAEILSQGAIPGHQEMVTQNGTYWVQPYGLLPGGYVNTRFSADRNQVVNVTTWFHGFVGSITRTIYSNSSGTYIRTVGVGNAGSGVVGRGRDYLNNLMGPQIFNDIDRHLKANIASKIPGC